MRISDWSSDVCSSDLLVFHALVLAAQAFIVLDRAKDARAEQAVPLRLEGAVVDRLRLLDLAVGPAPDAFWRSQSDLDLVKRLRLRRGVHEVHQFLVHAQVLPRNSVPLSRRERGKTLSGVVDDFGVRSEEHTSELQSLMRISYAVVCLT